MKLSGLHESEHPDYTVVDDWQERRESQHAERAGHLPGYDRGRHERYLSDIAARSGRKPGTAAALLVKLHLDRYGVERPDIALGLCEHFAVDLWQIIGGQPYWAQELPDGVAAWERGEVADLGHCFLRHADKYYDSNHPEGVADWRELLRT